MVKIDDGGPVHPCKAPPLVKMAPDGTTLSITGTDFFVPGISVRMYAAIHIAAGMLADSGVLDTPERIARGALRVADALIAADRKDREG